MLRAWAVMLCLLVSPAPARGAEGVPYGVDDLIALESIGQVMVDPTERLVVVERRRPHDQAGDYAYGPFQTRALSNIDVATLDHPGGLTRLFRQEPNTGYWMGGFSPSGRRLSVFRLHHRKLDLGVVDMATREVTWLDVAPDLPIAHPSPTWVGEDALVVIARSEPRLPFVLSIGNAIQTDLPELWAKAASGKVSSATVAATDAVTTKAGERQLVRIDLRTGRRTILASGAITDAAVSSRGAIAIVGTVAPVHPPIGQSISPDFVALRHVIDILDRGRRIRVADDVLPATMAWSDGGRKLAFVSRTSGGDWTHGRWQIATLDGEISVRSPDVVPTVEGRESSLIAHARWAGDRLLIQGQREQGPVAWFAVDATRLRSRAIPVGMGDLIFADAHAAWFQRDGKLTRSSLTKQRSRNVSDGVVATGRIPLDPSSVGTRLLENPVDPMAAVVMAHADRRQVSVIDRHGLSDTAVCVAGMAKVLAVGRHHVVSFVENLHGVGSLDVASGDGTSNVLARTNAFLAARTLPKVVEVRTRLSDGRTHSHWLFLPAVFDPSHPPPLVAMVYPGMLLDGGPPASTAPSFFLQPNNVPVLVGHGFAVLMPSLPSVGNGPDPLGVLAGDVEGAVDAVLARHLVDPSRMAVLGHSYGGFAALALATRTTRYRGIVAASGPYDIAAAHGSMAGADRIRLEFGLPLGQDAGWAEGGQARMAVAPWTDPARFVAKSPVYALDRVRAPLLLIHGETDVVSLEQAERAFMGLARLGKDATLVRYWGEGHVLASPANIRDYWQRVLSWLDVRFAAAVPAPPPETKPMREQATTRVPAITPRPSSVPRPRRSRA